MRRPGHRGSSGLLAPLWLAAALLVHGCATPPPRAPAVEPAPVADSGGVLARDDEYAVVVVRPGESLASLAQQYLGDARRDWWIAEHNGIAEARAGQALVIPLAPRNRIGVERDGYQTVTILCYHRFGSRASRLSVTPAAFAAQMAWLADNGYRVVSLAQLRDFLAGKEPLPRKSVAITIDDGYRSTLDIAFPVLKKHGFPATVFLYSDFVGAGDALSQAQMRELVASGQVDIQPHSKTHSNLTLRLPGESDAAYRERLRSEVDVPIRLIQERLALPSLAYAYPYGDVNEMVVDLLERRGVALGVTVTAGGNPFFAYPFMLRRTMVYGTDDVEAFKAKLVTFVRTPVR